MYNLATRKTVLSLLIDFSVAVIVYAIGIYLKIGTLFFDSNLMVNAIIFGCCALICNMVLEVYKEIWRYFNSDYIIEHVKYSTCTLLLFNMVSWLLGENTSYIININHWLLLTLATILSRLTYKIWREASFKSIFKPNNPLTSEVLLIGISKGAEVFIREMAQGQFYKIVGILDSKQNVNRMFCGIPIIGTISECESILQSLKDKNSLPSRVLVSAEADLAHVLKIVLNAAKRFDIKIHRLPKLTELMQNNVSLALQPINIEDLLHRQVRNLEKTKTAQIIQGKIILVTGAGGSIGSEIVRQLVKLEAKKIILLDNCEFLLYEIEQECKMRFANVEFQTYLADVRDKNSLEKLFNKETPQIIFHAAALKHVPLLESHKLEAASVNTIGTKNIVDAAHKYNVSQVVFISTDKAVEPSSFMGITKRAAEIYCQLKSTEATKITAVRFGNVLGSNGSVVPLFEKQIALGGPIKVTDAKATRYFMTITEAVELVMQSVTLESKRGGEIYVLDMGEPINILDLAEKMIMLAGLRPYIDIDIEFIGLRVGEKLHEILITEHENLVKTKCKYILLMNTQRNNIKEELFTLLFNAVKSQDEATCIKFINEIIGNY